MTSIDIAKNIERYFQANIIGSYILTPVYLSLEEIKDIDIACKEDISNTIRFYLIDNGYKETKEPIQYKGYERYEGSFIFTKENEKSIHINTYDNKNKDFKVFSISELLASKFNRQLKSDLIQIQKVVEVKLNNINNNG